MSVYCMGKFSKNLIFFDLKTFIFFQHASMSQKGILPALQVQKFIHFQFCTYMYIEDCKMA